MAQRIRSLLIVLVVLLGGCAGAKPPEPVLDREEPDTERLALIHSEQYVIESMPAQGDALREVAALRLDSLLTHYLVARARHFDVTIVDQAKSGVEPVASVFPPLGEMPPGRFVSRGVPNAARVYEDGFRYHVLLRGRACDGSRALPSAPVSDKHHLTLEAIVIDAETEDVVWSFMDESPLDAAASESIDAVVRAMLLALYGGYEVAPESFLIGGTQQEVTVYRHDGTRLHGTLASVDGWDLMLREQQDQVVTIPLDHVRKVITQAGNRVLFPARVE